MNKTFQKPVRFNTTKHLNLTLKGNELHIPLLSGEKSPDKICE